jgi:hypothetical protein
MTMTESMTELVRIIDRPLVRPVSFDVYRDIHKAIRVELFAVVADAGRLDASDDCARADLADQVDALVRLLQQHAEHEDGSILTPLEQASPALAARVIVEHEAVEARMDHLVALAAGLRTVDAAGARAATHQLYLDLAAFTSDYLAHQDLEERIIAPVLDAALGFEGLMGLNNAIVDAIPPQELSAALALMFPAMNIDDRTELLGGMKASAPAPVFEATWSLAKSVLTADDSDAVAARLGVQ